MNGSRHQQTVRHTTIHVYGHKSNVKEAESCRCGAWYFRLIDLNMMAGCYGGFGFGSGQRVSQSNNGLGVSGGRLSWSLPSTTNHSKPKYTSWFPSVSVWRGLRPPPDPFIRPSQAVIAIFQFPIKHAQNMSHKHVKVPTQLPIQ